MHNSRAILKLFMDALQESHAVLLCIRVEPAQKTSRRVDFNDSFSSAVTETLNCTVL